MGLPAKPISKNVLGISYNISNPPDMIAKANANVYSVMPVINPDNYHNSVGVIESGNVSIDLMKPVGRKKKKKSGKVKRKKSKNTSKTKDKK